MFWLIGAVIFGILGALGMLFKECDYDSLSAGQMGMYSFLCYIIYLLRKKM